MLSSVGSFGQWVRVRRKQRGLTQNALGRLAGYAEITVRQVEKDAYNLTPFVVECFVNCLSDERDDRQTIKRFALKQFPTDEVTTQYGSMYRAGTPFVGRDAELAQIAELLRNPECRCISIVGVGGIGKTRLAARAFASWESTYDARWINLIETKSHDSMVRAIADGIGITLNPFVSPSEQLLQALQVKNLLLVFDNYEQLLPDGTVLVNTILERAPGVKLMITSRERLQVSGEWSIRLQGLDTVGDTSLPDAVSLFISTARRMNHHYVPSDIEPIHEICRVIQGIPLAIEMAASWTELYSASEILNNLSAQVLGLKARFRDTDDRHKTLLAAFETSWNQLSPLEQYALKRLSVFRGGFTLDAAQQVAGAAPEVLAHLQDKMLIQPQSEGRLVLHEMIRQLAFQKLAADDDDLLRARLAHAEYFVQMLTGRESRMKYHYLRAEANRLIPEIENIYAAWEIILQQRKVDWFYAAWETLWIFFNITSRFHEGEKLFGSVLDAIDISTASEDEMHRRSFSQIFYSLFIFRQGRIPESLALLHTPEMDRIRASSDLVDQYWIHLGDSFLYHASGDGQAALASIQITRKVVEKMGNEPYPLAGLYMQFGRIQNLLGDRVSAHRSLSESLRLIREYGTYWGLGLVLTELGYVAEADQRLTDALEYYEAALAGTTLIEDLWNYHRTQISIGRVKLALGYTKEAVNIQKITLQTQIVNPWLGNQIDCFVEIALILKYFGETPLAIILLEYCAIHPECFQPTRNRSMVYLLSIREETPNIDVATARNFLPTDKMDVATMLLERLDRIQES